MVQPWDRQSLPAVEKAIQKLSIGLNPINDGSVLRLAIPQLTEEAAQGAGAPGSQEG